MKSKRFCVFAGMMLAVFFVVFMHWIGEVRNQSPLEDEYSFESVSEVVLGKHGKTYVIEHGKKTLLVLDDEKKLIRKISGGSNNSDFFYAARVCDDAEGNIYVADMIFGNQGNRIEKERIIKITENKKSVLYECDYSNCEHPPFQYGDILDLQEKDGEIFFLKKEEDGIALYRITEKESPVAERVTKVEADYYISDATYDVITDTIIITTRLGEIYQYETAKAGWQQIMGYAPGQIPWNVTAIAGEVYYSDLGQSGIGHYSMDSGEKPEIIYRNDSILYALALSADGKTITATNNTNFVYLDTESYTGQLCERVVVGNRVKVIVFWIVTIAVVIGELFLVSVFIIKFVKAIKDKAAFSRIALVVASSALMAVIASYSSISELMARSDEQTGNNMRIFAESLCQQIDMKQLQKLDDVSDYHSETYNQIKAKLDKLIEIGYQNETYYYYVIYTTDGININCVMDYEDTTVCGQPLFEYGDNEYTMVLTTGEEYTVSEVSSYGAWTFMLLPVIDENGNVIAALEVGLNQDQMVTEKMELIRENIITVLCSCGVLIMLILECIFAISFYEKRKQIPKEMRDITQQMPIRIMVFLVYVTDSMQDAFIAILCSRLYSDTLPISKELAIALPMSLQLLAAALFSAFGGRLAGKYGIRKLMRLGLASQMAGFLMCILIPGYEGILIGKLFIGIGLGTVYVTANTIASMGGKEEYVETGFADVSAGVLSGVTIGVGLGAIILDFADYRLVYLIGAIMLGCGLLLTVSVKNVTFEETKQKGLQILDIVKFLCKKRVAAFFLLILIPFMIALSYREYFFPLYVEQFGIDEVQIGRIYLGCGVLVLYIGPYLSKRILKMFGAGKSIMLASLCMAFNMAFFVVMPNLFSVIAGMVILSVVISFAYTCQYTYYERMRECSEVGMGNAMGIYSMFENIGQTMGPLIYGAAIMLGERQGIGLLAGLMLAMILIFGKIGFRRGKRSKK